MYEKINSAVKKIREKKPLILNITNDVTIDFVANGLLSLGASPVMSKASEEIQELLHLAHVIIINLGTLDEKFITLCQHACRIANQLEKPIVLDPVGAGATQYRTETSLKLLKEHDIAIVRGNASEVMALSGYTSHLTKGVDSIAQTEDAVESAHELSKQHNAVVVASGAVDLVIEGDKLEKFERGTPLMPQVTGTGCLLSAVVGAFHAVEKNPLEAAMCATLFYSVCGEIAAKQVRGPASFKVNFLDSLNTLPKRDDYETK